MIEGRRKSSVVREFRSAFKNLTLLNMNDNRNFYTYSGIDAMIYEQDIQRALYPRRIHPRSKFRMFWETFYIGFTSICVIYYFLSITTTRIVSSTEMMAHIDGLFVLSELPILINIVVNFITGYYIRDTMYAVMKFSAIWRHYVKTTFVFDAFGLVLGSPLMSYLNDYQIETATVGDLFLIGRAVGIFLRLVSPWHYLRTSIKEYYILDALSCRIIEFAVFFPAIISFITCVTIANSYNFNRFFNKDSTILDVADKFAFKALNTTMSKNVVKDLSHPTNLIVNLAALSYPYIMFFSLICIVLILYLSKHHASYRYQLLINNFKEYLQLVKISERLKIRIMKYYQEWYSETIYNEFDIMDIVSSEIIDDVLLLKIAKMREEIAIFRLIPNEELILICSRLRREVFFGNDAIAYCGFPNDRMYFIARGTVAFYTDEATEVFHIPVTTHFLWRGVDLQMLPTVANYLACETTILYSLTRRDFMIVRASCPTFIELMTFNTDLFIELIDFVKEKDLEGLSMFHGKH